MPSCDRILRRVLKREETMTENFRAAENDNSRLLVQHRFRFLVPRAILALAGVLALVACTAMPATTEKVLRIVPQSDLASLDPVYTTAGVTYNHANMIYGSAGGGGAFFCWKRETSGEIRSHHMV
jgi:hypothetical protein